MRAVEIRYNLYLRKGGEGGVSMPPIAHTLLDIRIAAAIDPTVQFFMGGVKVAVFRGTLE